MKSSRVSFVAALAAGSVLVLSGTAFAHVSVQPGQAEKGGYSTIAFKVPNERDNASTVKVEVTLPADHPLASVMPQDLPGWKVEVTKSKLAKPLTIHGKQITEAVTKVTWSGGKIEPGRFQQFPLSVGQLPEDADQLVFKAIQTYSNNEVVRWIEETKEGAEEPENPAPVLKLVAGTGEDHHDGAAGKDATKTDAKAGHDEHGDAEKASAAGTSDTTARALGIVGILVGVVGVAFGVLSRRRAS
ncbi:YcnI family protein [Streptomyces sp. NPDC089919]|uniref:YcnI family copper-binding membrane protein n=1 Tax=Streptomyces sp. NPDC089919 TaxID=3155188 RepID=UPI0034283B14